jgi:hypothetical protein
LIRRQIAAGQFHRARDHGVPRDPGRLKINFMNKRAKTDVVHHALKKF